LIASQRHRGWHEAGYGTQVDAKADVKKSRPLFGKEITPYKGDSEA